MKLKNLINKLPARLTAAVLVAAGAWTAAQAQTPLNAQLVLRPLTPGEVANTNYSLPASTEVSAGSGPGGIVTVPLGEPAYLEADVSIDVAASNIAGVTWTLTNAPVGSAATLQASPLGPQVPVYEPSDQLVYQVAGRKLLRPDVVGQYTVIASIATAGGVTTNLTLTFTAATYMGINTCALCHSGGQGAIDQYNPWSGTAHATIFSKGIDGNLGIGPLYDSRCLPCHTVGYDTNTNAVNGGFDDIANELGWTMPTVITNGNWASIQANYPALANVANIQCENCHGPGSQHAYGLGDVNKIAINFSSADCAQCHDEPPHHNTFAEWKNSLHAVTTRDPSGPGREACVVCHTTSGFTEESDTNTPSITTYVPINCIACHDAHSASEGPHQLRTDPWDGVTPVTLMDGTVVTNGGEGLLCMKCHHARQDAATYATSYHSYFGPHHGPQADMLAGVNGFTYGEDIPSSAHIDAITNGCVTCHMQSVSTTETVDGSPLYQHAGGHTWEMSYNGEDLVGACQQCHGPAITNFDFPLQDYDGDGVIEGVQTEVQNLLNKLSTLLPNASGVVDGLVKTPSPTATWTAPQLEADYNWQFVNNDGSSGIHNTAYAVGLLKASIANLTGDANNDGLPDAWQIQYFGSINSPDAAPNATPAGDGIPNWLKYSLGIDPTVPGIVLPTGVVWADGNSLVNSGGETNNVIHIYTAAEVSFDTQVGKTYQIQAISSLSGGWQNIGQPIAGTGKAVSYVTPTRQNVQQFYRVQIQ